MSTADPNLVILTGENPFIRLATTDIDNYTTNASFWRIIFCPAGPGHVLYLKSELTENRWRIYSDNIAMARWLQDTVQGMLNGELKDKSIPVTDAAFSKSGDYEAGCFRSSHFIEPDAIRPGLTTGDTGNLAFYSNPKVDKLLDEARQTADFETRKEKYFEVQELTAEDVPLITTLYDLFGNVYDATRAGPPPPGEPNSLGAIKPGFLYAVG